MPDTVAAEPAFERRLGLPLALLFISALPDAMVVPVLHDLMVQRHDVSPAAAHAFMCVNLVGALAIVGAIGRIRRSCGDGAVIVGAATINALLLAVMALPIGFTATLLVRFAEGAADLLVYGFLFDSIARAGRPQTKGRRMGAAATSLMLGIACGIGIGGALGMVDSVLSLWAGALACLLVAAAARGLSRRASRPAAPEAIAARPDACTLGPLWPALVMMFTDRAVVGVLVSTVPLYLVAHARLGSGPIGAVIGLSMLMTALGAWPAGMLADRFGAVRLRLAAGIVFALAFAGIVPTASLGAAPLGLVLIAFGAAGAALFAGSLSVVVRAGRGPSGMAAYHAAGNLGFLVGPTTAGLVLRFTDGLVAESGACAAIIAGFALLHLAGTAVAIVGSSTRFIGAADVDVDALRAPAPMASP